jgi:hypothetical protein
MLLSLLLGRQSWKAVALRTLRTHEVTWPRSYGSVSFLFFLLLLSILRGRLPWEAVALRHLKSHWALESRRVFHFCSLCFYYSYCLDDYYGESRDRTTSRQTVQSAFPLRDNPDSIFCCVFDQINRSRKTTMTRSISKLHRPRIAKVTIPTPNFVYILLFIYVISSYPRL